MRAGAGRFLSAVFPSAAVPSARIATPPKFGAAFRSLSIADLSLLNKEVSGVLGVRAFSTDSSKKEVDPPLSIVKDSDKETKPPLSPEELARRDHAAQALYMMFVQLQSLNDGMHIGGSRQEVVFEYYRNYLDFEKSLIGNETKEPFSTLDDGTKIFIANTEHGLAMVARLNHRVIGRMFIGDESTSEKHLSVLSSLSEAELKAAGVEKSPEFITSEMLVAYRLHLEKTDQKSVIDKSLKISCIGDYRHLVYAIAYGQPSVIREKDGSLKREIPLRSLLDGALEILAGKEIRRPAKEDAIGVGDLRLSDDAMELYRRLEGDSKIIDEDKKDMWRPEQPATKSVIMVGKPTRVDKTTSLVSGFEYDEETPRR
jgi:hypothetical protein